MMQEIGKDLFDKERFVKIFVADEGELSNI